MSIRALILIALLTLGLGACSRKANEKSDSVAKAAGRTAYGVVKQSEKAAKAAGRHIEKAAKEAHEGWNEAVRQDQARHKQQ